VADLLGQDAPDVEDFIACAMAPVMRCATERDSDDELPFCVVTRIAGPDDPDCGTDDPVVQLEFFDKARDGLSKAQAAGETKNRGHRRMTKLARDFVDVTMSDGSTANATYVITTLKPVRMPYQDDQIVRYVGRYQVGLSYVAVT